MFITGVNKAAAEFKIHHDTVKVNSIRQTKCILKQKCNSKGLFELTICNRIDATKIPIHTALLIQCDKANNAFGKSQK